MMNFDAVSNAVTNPAQAQFTSNVPAFTAPSRCCTTTDVAGESCSGVSVARMIRSNSLASSRAVSSAWRLACVARSAVLSFSAADVSLVNPENVSDKLVDILAENATQIIVRDDLFRNIDTGTDNIRKTSSVFIRVNPWLKIPLTMRLNSPACSMKNV